MKTWRSLKHWHAIVLPAPEKGQIDDGCEGIDKLQDEGFEDEALLKALVCLWNLWKRDNIWHDPIYPAALQLL